MPSTKRTYRRTLDHIRFNHEEDGHALAAAAGTQFYLPGCVSICRVRDDERLGGVIFSNYTGESIGIHMAGWTPYWVNRDVLYVTFDYPFNQLGVKRIFGLVPEDKQDVVDIDRRLGFKVVTRIEGVFPGNVACVVMRMDREDCRFLGVKPRNMISNKNLH